MWLVLAFFSTRRTSRHLLERCLVLGGDLGAAFVVAHLFHCFERGCRRGACPDCRHGPRALDFVVGDHGALGADELAGAGREVEHVALAHQLVGALAVEDDAAVQRAGYLEGDAAGNVRLDDAGDDIGARCLGGEDEMDAGGTRLLRDARNGDFDVGRRGLHEVGQLVDDDDDVGSVSGISSSGCLRGSRSLLPNQSQRASGRGVAVLGVQLVEHVAIFDGVRVGDRSALALARRL